MNYVLSSHHSNWQSWLKHRQLQSVKPESCYCTKLPVITNCFIASAFILHDPSGWASGPSPVPRTGIKGRVSKKHIGNGPRIKLVQASRPWYLWFSLPGMISSSLCMTVSFPSFSFSSHITSSEWSMLIVIAKVAFSGYSVMYSVCFLLAHAKLIHWKH